MPSVIQVQGYGYNAKNIAGLECDCSNVVIQQGKCTLGIDWALMLKVKQ